MSVSLIKSMSDHEWQNVLAEAAVLGRQDGQSAAGWVFNGNTDEGTYREILEGVEDYDPEVLNMLPGSPLSGEFSGDLTPVGLASLLDVDYESLTESDAADMCDAYEQEYETAVIDTVIEIAQWHLDIS